MALFRTSLAAAAALAVGAANLRASAPTPASVLAAMKTANDYYMANNAIGNCDWTRGTYYDGATAYYNVSSDSNALAYIVSWAHTYNFTCSDGSPSYDYDANKQCSGHAYARLYEMAPADYKLAMAVTLERQASATQGNPTLWNWVDALFMALPTWMKYGKLVNDTRLWDTAWANYQWTAFGDGNQTDGAHGLWSAPHGLFYRDATYFNKSSPNGSPVFWGRGNGWAISAMAESLEVLPKGSAYATEFSSKFTTMAASLAPLQGSDGLWRANLLDASAIPNPETTGSAMFTYALAWGVNNGYLDSATYTPIVMNAWNGLTTVSLQSNGLVGWCQPPNGQPAPATQTDTSDFCVGQFLMAGEQVYRMVSSM